MKQNSYWSKNASAFIHTHTFTHAIVNNADLVFVAQRFFLILHIIVGRQQSATRQAGRQTVRKNDVSVWPRERLIFFPRTTSFGDCTHVTAYFVVPTGADIIYTAEYRPERDISFQKNIFQSGERARAAKKYRPRAYAPVY